jgi:lipoprotein Spr
LLLTAIILAGCASPTGVPPPPKAADAIGRLAPAPTDPAAATPSPATTNLVETPPPNLTKRKIPDDVPNSPWSIEAENWMGTPYRFGGQSKLGSDCSGLVTELYKSVANFKLPRTSKLQYLVGDPVPFQSIKPGDLVFFNIHGTGVSHVGVALDSRRFVHASTRSGVVVSSLSEGFYYRTFVGARRVVK